MELLRNADLAMYWAESSGKNRLATYAESTAREAQDKAALLEDLAHALAGEQLEVYYQATVDVDDETTRGYEALQRGQHPAHGLVLPVDFIPLAESSGHILAIGAWVLRTATCQAATWTRERRRPVSIAVNLSAVQLAGDDIVGVVSGALDASGLPAAQLTLEVTESLLMHDLEEVARRLGMLRRLGVRIAIDDFGTGYSSLSYLRRLPAGIVKIDRSFVTDVADGGPATTLVASIIELARSLGLDIVAEGVETSQQADVLRALNCTYAQGCLYARPAPAEQVRTTPLPVAP